MAAVKELAKDGKPMFFRVPKGSFFEKLYPRLLDTVGIAIALVCDSYHGCNDDRPSGCDDGGRCDRFRKAMEDSVRARGGDVAMGVLDAHTNPKQALFFWRAFGCPPGGAVFLEGRGDDRTSRAKTLVPGDGLTSIPVCGSTSASAGSEEVSWRKLNVSARVPVLS